MAINLNESVWGKKEHLVQPTGTSYRHTCILYPYYVATDEYYAEHPISFVSQRNALYNADNGIQQTTDVSTVDMSICSWSIPTAAAVNHVWYMGRYNDDIISTSNAGLVEVTVDDRQSYPTYFTMGNKNGGYTYLNNSSHLLDNYNNNINIQSAEYRTRIGSSFPGLSTINTPIVSFGYKAALNVVYVTCCTETYFYETVEYGDIINRVPTIVTDSSTYRVPLYNYYHNEINGTKINEIYPVVLNVEIVPYFDQANSNVETSNPSRYNNTPYIYPMSFVKYRSLKDIENTTIFGNNSSDPWYNNTHVYLTYGGYLILGMYYSSGNNSAPMATRGTNALEALAAYTSSNTTSQFQTWNYCRSKQLETKEITKLIRYDSTSCYIRLGYKDLTEAEILREAAYQGLWFAADTSKINVNLYDVVNGTADLSSATENGKYIFMPKFDEHLVTTGEYVSAYDINSDPTAYSDLININWGWRFNLSNDYNYDPSYDPPAPPPPHPEPETEDTGDIANIGFSRRFGNHLKVWCLYQNQIDTIVSAINDIYQSSSDPVVQWQTDFQGVNPADYIVGFYAMLLTPPRTDTTSTFTLGAVDFDGGISAYRYNFNAANAGFFTFGEVDIPNYGNFLDYAPYTQLEVYIPLCGTVEVDTAYFMGHKMCIDMYYDVYTMSCVAAIYRISSKGKTLYKTVNGTIGAQIPILSKNMGDYQSTIHALESAHRQNENRLITSMMTAGISAAVAIGSGGAAIPAIAGIGLGGMGMINTLEQQKQIEYQLDHTQPTIAQTGVAETQNSFCVGQLKAKLNIKRAYVLPHDDSVYSSTVGNACCINTTVGDMSGLTICSDLICDNIRNVYGDSPTVEEINAIKQAFSNGVIV